jgi:peptidoglycan/LPS O-acetylase OafA/YrhL
LSGLEAATDRDTHTRTTTVNAPAIQGRIPSLDGLRGLSILCVLLGHLAMSDNAPRSLAPFIHLGNIGVRFFFVISGFLITTLLLKEWEKTGTISLKNFYLRRAFRIMPAAYTLIAIVGLLGYLGWIALRPGEVFYASVFLMNYHDFRALYLGQLWSLAVEEQFYLLWPGLVLLAGLRWSFRWAAIVVFFVPCLRAVMWYGLHASETAMTKHFESVADALAIGCLLAAYYNRLGKWESYRKLQARAVLFFVIASGMILFGNALFVMSPGAFYVWGQTLANIGTVFLIDWAIRNPERLVGRLLDIRALAFIGTLSYSLYLWQNPFFLGGTGTIWTSYPYNMFFVAGAALASYFLVERPFLQLKSRLEEPRAAQPGTKAVHP